MTSREDAKKILRLVVKKAYECGETTHLGGALSIIDILAVLYREVLNYKLPLSEDMKRDIFILSKGHCALSYYSTLAYFGVFSMDELDNFQVDGSSLTAHPVKNQELGIESSNGSLGQGLSFGLGVALALRLRNEKQRRTFVLLGDGECNEGSVWETAASASEFGVSNLCAIVDVNGYRNDGPNTYFSNNNSLSDIWKSFGWNVLLVDGHQHEELVNAFERAKEYPSGPSVILAKTVKGHGVSLMENNNDWHHNRITQKIYDQIIGEIENLG